MSDAFLLTVGRSALLRLSIAVRDATLDLLRIDSIGTSVLLHVASPAECSTGIDEAVPIHDEGPVAPDVLNGNGRRSE